MQIRNRHCSALVLGSLLMLLPSPHLLAQPADGTYSGATSQSRAISVEVTNGEVASWTLSFQCGPTSGTITVNPGFCPIVNNSFDCGSAFCAPGATTSQLEGTFNGNTVSGTFTLSTQPIAGSCCTLSDFSWSASMPDPPLFDLTGNCSTAGTTSQFFTDFQGGSDLSDDFQVPVGEQWSVTQVGVEGFFGNNGADAPTDSVNVNIYSDNGGLPGALECMYPELIPASGVANPDFALDLVPACELSAGVYWLQVQAVMPFDPGDRQWFWSHSIETFGNLFAFQDTLDLFGTGCTSWQAAASCFDPPPSDDDLCFALSGTSTELPSLSINDVSVVEGDAGTTAAEFIISLSAASNLSVEVDFATSDGTATVGSDYSAASGTVTFPAGTTTQVVTVHVLGDILDELDEMFFVDLSNPTNATILDNQGKATILDDDDPPSLSIDDVSVVEGDAGTTAAEFTVSLSTASGLSVSVDYASVNGTAMAGSDYSPVSGTLIFPAGTTTRPIMVQVIGDTLDELDEMFFIDLTQPSNASILDDQGLGTIVDDDEAPSLSIDDVSVVEGNAGTTAAVFTVSLSTASGLSVSVDYASADGTAMAGSDYSSVSGTLVFPAGTTTWPITVPVIGDTLAEPLETFFVNLSNPVNATLSDNQGEGTILDDENPIFTDGFESGDLSAWVVANRR